MENLKKDTQYDKILKICAGGRWVCQREFWSAYIRSPHKRRKEMEAKGYFFEKRRCPHGKNEMEYRLVESGKSHDSPTVDKISNMISDFENLQSQKIL